MQATISELLATGEKILVYLATHRDMVDRMVDYLFEYKQLIKLDNHLRSLQYSMPDVPVEPPVAEKKAWWKFGK